MKKIQKISYIVIVIIFVATLIVLGAFKYDSYNASIKDVQKIEKQSTRAETGAEKVYDVKSLFSKMMPPLSSVLYSPARTAPPSLSLNNANITNAIIPDETYNSAYTDYPIKKYIIHDNGNISVWTTNGKFYYGSNITLYGKSK